MRNGRLHHVVFRAKRQRTVQRAPREARLPAFLHLASVAVAASVIAGLRVAIVGCGAVGRYFALALARLEPAAIALIDPARYKAESLNTQAITAGDVGKPKAASTAAAIKAIHHSIEVSYFDGPIGDLRDDELAGFDLVFAATDNLNAEIEVNRRCMLLGLPLLVAAVYGDALIANVTMLSNASADGPCLACGYGEAEWGHAERETIWTCDPNALTKGPDIRVMPTRSVAGLSSLAADLAMVTLLRWRLKLGAGVLDTRLEYAGYLHQTTVSPLVRHPDCPADHLPRERRASATALPDCTLRELAAAAGIADLATTPASFQVDEQVLVEQVTCGCGKREKVRRFGKLGRPLDQCRTCQQPIAIDSFTASRAAPADALGPALDKPLRTLGARSAKYVIVRDAGHSVFFTNPIPHSPGLGRGDLDMPPQDPG